MIKEITTRKDITLLVESFYTRVMDDEVIGYIFRDLEHFSWDTHIPVMIDFWCTLLLDEMAYKGNPMIKHIDLHRRTPLTQEHFTRWKHLFFATLDDLFEGERVNEAKKRVEAMEILMLMKIRDSEQQGFIQ
ncbi:MAG: group III truncated hemoglobin [Saprospiraceae bacterium]|nr:group III truncated hemoglobin [Saprospiraceae bacterium]